LITGNIYEGLHEFREYSHLRTTNDSLASENAKLRASLLSFTQDSLAVHPDTQYTTIACEVINNNILGRNNMMTLNKGSDHGMKSSMGLIDDSGVVGIVKEVGNSYSTAYSILNTDLNISARIRRNKYFGTLNWKGSDIREATLRSIPKHADVKIGDTVTTTSYSTIFPPDIPIGSVEDVAIQPGKNDFLITVKLFSNLANAHIVYAVQPTNIKDRIRVEQNSDDE
jgi:rod shape-determining protein MreC